MLGQDCLARFLSLGCLARVLVLEHLAWALGCLAWKLNAVLLEEVQGVGADFVGAVLDNAVAGTFDGDNFRVL